MGDFLKFYVHVRTVISVQAPLHNLVNDLLEDAHYMYMYMNMYMNMHSSQVFFTLLCFLAVFVLLHRVFVLCHHFSFHVLSCIELWHGISILRHIN